MSEAGLQVTSLMTATDCPPLPCLLPSDALCWELTTSGLAVPSSLLSPVAWRTGRGLAQSKADSWTPFTLSLLPGILQICDSFAPSVVLEEQEKEPTNSFAAL